MRWLVSYLSLTLIYMIHISQRQAGNCCRELNRRRITVRDINLVNLILTTVQRISPSISLTPLLAHSLTQLITSHTLFFIPCARIPHFIGIGIGIECFIDQSPPWKLSVDNNILS